MSITIALSPEEENGLRESAARAGQDVAAYVRQIIQREIYDASEASLRLDAKSTTAASLMRNCASSSRMFERRSGRRSTARRAGCHDQKRKHNMTIHLPAELERFVHDQVVAGRYSSEDEVVRAALEQLRMHAPLPPGPGSIGAMRDDADLLDHITQDIMESRRTRTLRFAADE